MKSIAKLMVVAMLLAAALVVAPVAARTYVGNADDGIGKFSIDPADTVYIGEQHLNFSTAWNNTTGGSTILAQGARFVHYTDTTKGTYDKAVTISSPDDFELTSSDFGTTTGTYHVLPINASISEPVPNGTPSLYVEIPKVTLDVVLQKSKIDSVDGKTVTRDNELAFKLQNNLGGFRNVINGTPQMKIEVTLPSGGVTTNFGNVSLEKITVNGSTVYKENIDLKNETAGTYTAQAKWYSSGPGASFYGKGFDSNPVTFVVSSKKLAITSDKDSVVRSKSFSVTIIGESKTQYFLFVKDADLKENQYPKIRPSQPGVKNETVANYSASDWENLLKTVDNKTVPDYAGTHALVETTAGGTRTVQFDTDTTTDDRQFTIRVQDLTERSNYDEVKVKVVKGAVTITAAGTGTYYIGEEITLEGTCTESDYVYLFITGPNLPSDGAYPLNPSTDAVSGNKNTFIEVEVEADDTWSEKWNTAEIDGTLDAGGYTIYAVSAPVNKKDLTDAEYDTISIQLRSGFISAVTSGAVVAKGDDLKLTGVAQGDPDRVKVWIFGKNYYGEPSGLYVRSATVEDDGTFELKLDKSDTEHLSAGQYFVVIQHPMMNGEFDIDADESTGTIKGKSGSGFTEVKIVGLQAAAAANALIKALDSPNIDDTYVKLTFVVEEARILIDPIGDVPAGSTFTISGTTNLAVGDTLNIEVTSAAFTPTEKGEGSGFASVARTTEVKAGDGANVWSVEIDGSSFKPDQYIVKVECIESDTTATANFNVIEAVPTTPSVTPTGTVTTTTPPATTTVPPTETETPGFGALLALAGLGAVAYLVLRRD